jgi:hypothetical protein
MPVTTRTYDELRLRFERRDDAYRVYVTAPCGEASGRFQLPFEDLEIENFVLRASRGRQAHRRMESAQTENARIFGGRLFGALFRDRVRDVYQGAMSDADRTGHGLRITLALTDTPELMDLPWEFLYDEPNFLAISVMTPVVRYLDLPRQRRPLAIEPPLRILGMVSSPTDAVPLDTERERANLDRALGGLVDSGLVELHWLERATLSALLHELRRDAFHVFHYIGHGMYDPEVDDGVLLLEDEDRRGRPVSGTELGTILHDCRSLRLAVLNACEGARTARDDPFAGVAASLVQREIPAVIAMQFEITDQAAVVFGEGFYEAVAAGFPVDAALAEARKSIFADHNDIEWGTPVLFMRVADGRIFEVPGDSVPARVTRLAVGLSVTPAVAYEGEQTTWRLGVQNLGRSPMSSLTAVNGEGRRLCGPIDLAAGATHDATWTAVATTDTDQTVTVGAETARGDKVSGQASAHLRVRARPQAPPAPAPSPAPPVRVRAPDSRGQRTAIARPPVPVESPWHVNAGVVIGEGFALLGAATMLAVDIDKHGLHRHLEGLAQTPAKWGWVILGAVVCAVVLRTLVAHIAPSSPIGVLGSLIAALVVLAVSVDLISFILADPAFQANHGYGALVALGGGAIAALGGFIAVLGGLTAAADGARRARRRGWQPT